MVAIEHATRVIYWQDNLTSEEMPPEWMWPLDEEVADHMEAVHEERKRKFGKDDDDDGHGLSLNRNELSKGRGRDA